MPCCTREGALHEAVEQIRAKTQLAASARIVRFSDEMWRALLDLQQP